MIRDSNIGEGNAVATADGEIDVARIPADEPIDANEQHLKTDHLLSNLRGRTVSGAFVTITAQGVQFVISFVSIMVLSRLLTPNDFGLFAMVATIVGYLRVFKDAGLSTATIQREGITQAQVSNLFWINVALSGGVTVLLAASAPLVARFYHDPRLTGITLTLSGTFLLNGLAVQHTALLSRQMRFKALAVIQISSSAIGLTIAIWMAVSGYDYWALVISNLATVLAMTIFTWLAIPWRPHGLSRRSGIRPLIAFGANIASSGFIYSLARGADSMLIGRCYGAGPLGLYSRAAALLNRPMDQFLSPISSVFVPVLSRVQNEPDRYRRSFLQVYEAMALLSCLFTGLLFALARPITLVVLGRKWEDAALIFAAFTAANLFTAPITASTWLFASQGRGRDSLVSSVLMSVITLVSFVVGIPFGPAAVAIVGSIMGVGIAMPTLYYFAGRRGPVTTSDLWARLLRYLPLWALVCGTTYLARVYIPNMKPFLQLIVCAPIGLLAGAVMIFCVASMRRTVLSLIDLLAELKSRKTTRSAN